MRIFLTYGHVYLLKLEMQEYTQRTLHIQIITCNLQENTTI